MENLMLKHSLPPPPQLANKAFLCFTAVFLAAALLFTGCPGPDEDPEDESFTVSITQAANGTIDANPKSGKSGTTISITAGPNLGYKLSWIKVDGTDIDISGAQPFSFTLTKDIAITGAFEPLHLIFHGWKVLLLVFWVNV